MLGSGILQGLVVTAKNFVGSYHDPARMVTQQYPEEPAKLPANYRNFPFLVSENATDPMGTMRCVACQICEKECPPQCIYIEKSKDKKPDATGKMQLYPAVFAIDTAVCMSCQLCVEVCPFDAIKMDHEFAIATTDRFTGLLLNREELAKPNSYFHQIRPEEATEVDARLAAERKAAEEKARLAAAAKAASPVAKPPDEPRRSPPGEGGPPKPAAPVAGVARPEPVERADPGQPPKDGPASPRPATDKPATGGATAP